MMVNTYPSGTQPRTLAEVTTMSIREEIEEFKEILNAIHNDKFFKKLFPVKDSEYAQEEWALAIEIYKKR